MPPQSAPARPLTTFHGAQQHEHFASEQPHNTTPVSPPQEVHHAPAAQPVLPTSKAPQEQMPQDTGQRPSGGRIHTPSPSPPPSLQSPVPPGLIVKVQQGGRFLGVSGVNSGHSCP